MKTAMQEMIDWVEEKFNNPHQIETFKKATELLEKEKKQIEKTWFDSTAQFDNAAEMTYKKLFEEYYNQTYNQNK
jgi:t-SNARE complex subunit (syntaxin)